MDNNVGKRIKYYRLQRGMSQEQLALQAEINPAFLGHLERGMKSPTMTTLDKIVNALGLSYSEFFDDSTDNSDTEGKRFYMDMIVNSAKRLPDDKLKIAADIMLKLTELAD
ncbi:MAG: helix-turn-helix transcriptional regulator [Ruminococcus sp.]|nr:helix-turn-helix transcriptional regulator [Ruminococcus sp.]